MCPYNERSLITQLGSGMSEEIGILKLVCHRLDEAAIPYMLTGSFAANFYAVPRMTRDIDLVIEVHKAEADTLFQIFKNDFYVSKSSIVEAIESQGMFNIIHNEYVFKIDFIICKDTPYRNKEFQRKRQVLLYDDPIWIVAPEDLIISKLFWAKDSSSEMQIRDVKNLFLSLKNLDKEYIDEWIQTLKLDAIYQQVKD
jgi:hypothetical protein